LNCGAKAFATKLDVFQEVFVGGILSIYTGQQPDSADDEPTGLLLCEAEIPGFAVRNGSAFIPLPKNKDIDLVGMDTSTMEWFRIAGNKNTRGIFASLDGAIASRHKDCDLEMSNQCIIAGAQITIEGLTIDLRYLEDYNRETETAKARGEDEGNRLRKRARRKLQAKGMVKPNDGKDVDHVKGVGAGNGDGNLQVLSKSSNRSFPRTSSGAVKKP
jgi:hypothetical protein